MQRRIFSRPADRSLPAFKAWMLSMTSSLNPNATNTILTKQWIDEEGWVSNWKAFWAQADDASKPQGPGEEQ